MNGCIGITMFAKKPKYSKLKTLLKLTSNRLKFMGKKRGELTLKARRDIAEYIKAGKHDRARIRVEQIIREDYLVEAMEMVELYCDLLQTRFGLIERMKHLDPALEEAVATIIWITHRLHSDIPEIKLLSKQLTYKYGKEYADACRANIHDKVSDKVMQRMTIVVPSKTLVEQYMVEIARTYSVPYTSAGDANNSTGGSTRKTPSITTYSDNFQHPTLPRVSPPPSYRSNYTDDRCDTPPPRPSLPTQQARSYPRLPSYLSREREAQNRYAGGSRSVSGSAIGAAGTQTGTTSTGTRPQPPPHWDLNVTFEMNTSPRNTQQQPPTHANGSARDNRPPPTAPEYYDQLNRSANNHSHADTSDPIYATVFDDRRGSHDQCDMDDLSQRLRRLK